MAFDALQWWTCEFCGSPLFFTQHDNLTEMIAGHFQRCPGLHLRLAALYQNMATNRTEKKASKATASRKGAKKAKSKK